ncbi:MAG TPA: tRNA (adenosine(37)-N6)-threonylcarbamoyltransferase complex ATPase subunit type 1 TsaE [Thermomicrobiales bacterium]|nr:tRNA (adenosine(37)-N6)-threonylcarbamoyltransferase complex ATPase subunit type 1 TsaE [Thermomicrobiales bacterium]
MSDLFPVDQQVVRSGAGMRELGERLSRILYRGDVVLLHGDLGAGKTTLVQGLAQGLGIEGPVQSPTFAIVAEHEGLDPGGERLILYHLDLYRLTDPHELHSIGYDQYLEPHDGVSAIEWPERAGDWLPDRFILVKIEHAGADVRHVSITRHELGGLSPPTS